MQTTLDSIMQYPLIATPASGLIISFPAHRRQWWDGKRRGEAEPATKTTEKWPSCRRIRHHPVEGEGLAPAPQVLSLSEPSEHELGLRGFLGMLCLFLFPVRSLCSLAEKPLSKKPPPPKTEPNRTKPRAMRFSFRQTHYP